MGASNDKSQQNDAAQAQIHQNTAQAQSNLTNWLAANPSVLAQFKGQIAPPQQFSGAQGPPSAGMMPQQQQPQGQNPALMRALQQRMPQGMPQRPPGGAPPQQGPTPQPTPGIAPAGTPAYQGGPPPGLLGLVNRQAP